MKFKNYLDENTNLTKQARLLRFVVFILVVAVVINGYFVYSSRVKSRTILIPPYLSEGEAYVSGKDASDNYLEAMAKYACFLRLNYTPANVSKQFNAFLKLLTPPAYKEQSGVLYKQKEDVIQMNVSSSFFPIEIEIDRANKRIFVTGMLNQWTYDKHFVTDERKTYVIEYRIDFGRFFIENFIGCGKSKQGCFEKVKTEKKEV